LLNSLFAYFGIILTSSDDLARRLASDILRLWGSDIYQLAESDGRQELQRRYMEIAMATGLPGSISKQVASKAWGYVRQAQQVPVVNRKGFSFYT
jgi:hypothetical protein